MNRAFLKLLLGGAMLSAASSSRADFDGPYELQNWTMSGIVDGTTSITPASGAAQVAEFAYSVDYGESIGVSPRTTTFSVTANRDGVVCFDWNWDGYHAWCCPAQALLQVYAETSSGTTVIDLVNQGVSGPFSFSGTASIDVEEGMTFGIIVGGSNFDSDSVLEGVVTISEFSRPLAFDGGYSMDHWSSTGITDGTTEITPSSGNALRPEFSYNVNLGDPGFGVEYRSTTFSATAPADGPISFDWIYSGFHAFFDTQAVLIVYAETSGGTVVQILVDEAPFDSFTYSGTATINVEKGRPFGIIVGGRNFDSNSQIYGTVTLSKLSRPMTFVGPYELQNWTDTGIAEGVTSINPSTGAADLVTYSYDVDRENGVSFRTAELGVIAQDDGTVSFDWDYSGFHAFFMANAVLEVYADSCLGREVITLVASPTSGEFQFQGSASIDVYAGHEFGIRVGGDNFDLFGQLKGAVTISSFCPEVRECPADMNDSGTLNVFDFLTFQTYFSDGNARADLALPCGVLNVFDFLTFQTLFSEGC